MKLEQPIPLKVLLTVTVRHDGKTTDFTCTTVGYSHYGLQVTLPQVLDRYYTLPATTMLECTFITPKGNQRLGFKSYVMGYERTEPPLMVLALPDALEHRERRAAARWPVQLPLGYIAGDNAFFAERTHTVDLSMTGLQMITSRLLPLTTPLTITLDLTEETVLLNGLVIWSAFRGRRAGCGIHFTRLGTREAKLIAGHLQALERELRAPRIT